MAFLDQSKISFDDSSCERMARADVFDAGRLYTSIVTPIKAINITTTATSSRMRCRRLEDDWPVQSIIDGG